ncbi:sulfurtransferase, partial [Cellulosimicrobium cellulans]|uniref:sulfurtransferase n=2 Tax=Cellulosimicrobium TaxID=157920 RepID=UPI001883186B
GGTSAARAWWLLRWAGHDDVRLLDGGLPAWRAAGYPTEEGDVRPEPGDVVVSPGGMPVLDADGAAGLAASGVLLDARAGERYRGEVEPVDPRAGHVPGAVSAPTTDNLAADGTFLDPDALRARFVALGVAAGTGSTTEGAAGEDAASRPVGVYCGSGVTAAHEVAALATLGVDAALYAGSWSQWSNDPDRPVAT